VHARGHAVAVMIARGASGTPCRSEALFHGARVTDFAATVALVRTAAKAAATAAAATASSTDGTTAITARVYGVGSKIDQAA
jgi:predicted alpha/beta-fold hydrolase